MSERKCAIELHDDSFSALGIDLTARAEVAQSPDLASCYNFRMHESHPNNPASHASAFDVQLDGARLRVEQIGKPNASHVIVFLHDSFGCIKLWRDFPEKLCQSSGCGGIVYDRQGYGESSPFTQSRRIDYLEKEADVLIDLLEQVGGSNFVLFGHSDGGSIALIAASKLGGDNAHSPVKAVITEGAHVFVEERTLEGIRVACRQKDALLRRLSRYHGNKTESVFTAWADTWLSSEFRGFNIEQMLPRITCPVLVIQGADDEYGTEKQVDAIVSQVSGPAQKRMITGVGHTPHKDAAEETIGTIASFVHQL